MNIRADTVLVKKPFQDARIRGRYLLPIKPLQSFVVGFLMNSQRETAFAETQPSDDVSFLIALHKLIFSYYTQIGHTSCHALRYIVIAQEKHLYRKISRLGK